MSRDAQSDEKESTGSRAKKLPAWWPTAQQKAHADAACAHPGRCNLTAPPGRRTEDGA